jgi:hypothetical protein
MSPWPPYLARARVRIVRIDTWSTAFLLVHSRQCSRRRSPPTPATMGRHSCCEGSAAGAIEWRKYQAEHPKADNLGLTMTAPTGDETQAPRRVETRERHRHVVTLSPLDYDAVLFDLDGVLTKTARVHAAAWKRLFDGFLEQRAADIGEAFVPFDIDADYRRYVDGKPRYDGVAAFLESRGIELPVGAPEDDPGVQSVRALGNLKDEYFLQPWSSTASSATRTRSP